MRLLPLLYAFSLVPNQSFAAVDGPKQDARLKKHGGVRARPMRESRKALNERMEADDGTGDTR
jgi:hypothetical protein